jgi:hypothetical protein
MHLKQVFLENLINLPITLFFLGILSSIFKIDGLFSSKIHSFITQFLLFLIGFKGAKAIWEDGSINFIPLLLTMIVWGCIQPMISYSLFKKFSKIDSPTAIACAACFGSVSVMTFISGTAFLEKLNVPFQPFIISTLAIMEIPSIVSALFIYRLSNKELFYNTKNLWIHTLLNKTILMIVLGMTIGAICHVFRFKHLHEPILFLFQPSLCLFLFFAGITVGKKRNDLHQFSWALSAFGIYMPLIGGGFGILLSYLFNLDVGSGTMIAVISASASYIAAPAAMKIAIPTAKETIYIPLSLAIAFPFNIMIGTPIFYLISTIILK